MYKCKECHAEGIQLWRKASSLTEGCDKLICKDCAKKMLKNLRFVDHVSGYLLQDMLAYRPVLINQVMPAVPEPPPNQKEYSGLFHLGKNPAYNEWWRKLPEKK